MSKIEIKHRYTGAVLYAGEHETIRDAVEAAVKAGAYLAGANLARANLAGANLARANLPSGFRVAHLCFGGWSITVTPQHTTIGCQRHDNDKWLAWLPGDVSHMHSSASAWWADHGEAIKAVIRNVMQEQHKVEEVAK